MKYLLLFLILISIAYAVCDGCLLNNECIEIGVQRLTEENGYEVYCGQDKVIYQAKEDGEMCSYDYECLSYYCDNSCKDIKKESNMKVFGVVILIILVLAIIYFVYKKRPRRVMARRISVRKGTPRKVVVKKRIDPLEKGIKESLDNLSSIFKKRKP